MLFQAMLNQEIGWFDDVKNQPGILTGCLAADVPTLQSISGRRLGAILEVFTLIIICLVVAFAYSWQIALVALAYFPVVIIAGAFNVWLSSITCPQNFTKSYHSVYLLWL